jgi:hypothetical protein
MFDIIRTQLEQGFLVYPAILVLLMIFAFLSWRIIRSVLPPRPVKAGEVEDFNQLLSDAGYAFDPSQGIFYTKMNAWQRKYGYCRLYDEAMAPTGMIIDSDPVHFEYAGKRWLIQFWKGQYYLNTGCEIGVYYTEEPDLSIPNLFNGTFYKCVDNANRLDMAYILYKNGRELFHGAARHWWLTGFKPGEFSEPWELSMRIRITFKDTAMCRSFIRAMKKIGYQEHEIISDGITAEFVFDKTRTAQPLTRTEETDWIIQRNNERVCRRFMEITEPYATWPEKLAAIRQKEPFLYEAVISVGKTKQIFKAFDKLKNYI